MNVLKLIFLITLISFKAVSQTCSYKKLSKEFDFTITLNSKKLDSIQVLIKITNKVSQKIQALKIETEGLYIDSFNDCKNVKSYSTKINSELPTGDENDSGNFIVADFNFDGMEDLAIKRDVGGNGGPLYAYFLQAKDKKFYESLYLSNTVEFFPIEINSTKKTITTFLHANAYQKNRRIFKYNQKAKKWKLIYDKLE
ncbi:hypothetical protein OX283_003010 [Flavobacterium sp. SUN052]|uniref:XAC2610-related protein n=1 Tax=Flavobacterium sp. SUN052 TaxID=3002441 RepID=UPI00237D4271|nr:hypothetical protein [Flavobacterium sp. SUN052]MEC4003617.1 hypothetical protein [Flavobacterium sp. SUN052]